MQTIVLGTAPKFNLFTLQFLPPITYYKLRHKVRNNKTDKLRRAGIVDWEK